MKYSLLVVAPLNSNIDMESLLGKIPTWVTELYLGHDGVIYAKHHSCSRTSRKPRDIVRSFISGLPNLERVHHCHYYSDYDDDLYEICEEKNIEVFEIY